MSEETTPGSDSDGSSVGPPARSSFEAVYAATAPRLIHQLYLVIGDLSEAQDCVQEAYARAWSRWDRITATGGGDPVGWVKTTAYRLAVSRWRHFSAGLRALRRHGVTGDPQGPNPDTVAVRDALAALPMNQRMALVLYHIGDLTVDEIAAQLDVPSGTVKARLARGRKALATLLADDPDPSSSNTEASYV
ncbi:SigE family RNA polymerase sigma factor [Catenulispora sp. NF23]|uniref:SigE family RNA polymerase sigma factor n=1 Tax=Catenulispora pinistramenti TaxID=2705254 RepID=UPI001BAD1B97|nr:SigE family RNA polymerase sigma factor [Catenulispora pinistramenti]MBS2533441.1 SigE family RNA polymerase sigma factor [Catenulispora pinistramenti]